MKRKWRTLFILFFTLLPLKARTATYNFNFYNNDKEENANSVPAPTILPAPAAVVPLAPTTPLSSSDVATQKVEEIKESLISFGYFYYGYNNLPKAPERDSDPDPDRDIFIGKKTGQGFKIGLGKRGGLKAEIEGLKERGSLIQATRYHSKDYYTKQPLIGFGNVESIFKLYGIGLNLKKELKISNALSFELGIGAQYLKGKRDQETLNYEAKEYNYQGLLGLNLYYDKISFNLSGRMVRSQLKTRIDTDLKVNPNNTDYIALAYENKKIIHTAGMATIGLTYHF